MELYNYFRSSASYRVRIALALKGLDYDYMPVQLARNEHFKESYAALSPARLVPLLKDDERIVTQSLAIIEYLDDAFPGPRLLPEEPFVRARVRQLSEIVNAGIQPLQNLEVMRYVREDLAGDATAWARHFVGRGMRALEAEAVHTASAYLVGDRVTLADCCLAPQLYACRRFGVDVADYPTLLRVEARLQALEAYKASHPDAQPDAQP